ALKQTQEVTLDLNPKGGPALLPKKTGLFGGKPIHFDVALPSFHGLFGEDGGIQGLFDLAGVPYAGMRTMASSILMDKAATKLALKALDIPALDYAVLKKPESGYLIPRLDLEKLLAPIGFPCII